MSKIFISQSQNRSIEKAVQDYNKANNTNETVVSYALNAIFEKIKDPKKRTEPFDK